MKIKHVILQRRQLAERLFAVNNLAFLFYKLFQLEIGPNFMTELKLMTR